MNEPSRPSLWRFDWRVFSLAKDAEYPAQNQDACLLRGDGRFAAIADGVSSAIFSRPWARLLVEAIQDEPDVEDRQSFAPWLRRCREAWSRQIDVSQLQWFQRPKLREGAFSTLLWTRLVEAPQGDSVRLQARAIGDSCLFLLRGGRTLRTFPLATSADLERRPLVLGSVDLHHDDLLAFNSFEEPCRLGDLVILCTDALAAWALQLAEAGDEPPWESFWTMTERQWQDQIELLRADQLLVVDDTTLAMLRVTDVPLPVEDRTSEPASESAIAWREPAEGLDAAQETPLPSATGPVGASCAAGSASVLPGVRVPLPPAPGPIRVAGPPVPSAAGSASAPSEVHVPRPAPPKPPSLLEVVTAEEVPRDDEEVIDLSSMTSEDCPDELKDVLDSPESRPEPEPPSPEKKALSPTKRLLREFLTGVEKFLDDISPKDKKKRPGE